MKKQINGIFAALVCLVIAGSTAKAAAFPHDINEYENRYAEKLCLPTAASVLSGEFQDRTEAALADQLPYAEEIKEEYNLLFSSYNSKVLSAVMARLEAKSQTEETPAVQSTEISAKPSLEPLISSEVSEPSPEIPPEEPEDPVTLTPSIADPTAHYFTLPSGRSILKDHLMYDERKLSDNQDKLDKRIADIKAVIESHPDTDFYAYFIEKETEINFVEGTRTGIPEYVEENLALEPGHFNMFRINTFEEYDDWFYKTDHHLNNHGGLELYKRLLSWLLPDETPLEPTGEYQIGYYSGSKATGTDAQTYKDVNTCYTYDYPKLITFENGSKIGYYGAQEYYVDKVSGGALLEKITYGQLFGQDSGEIRFENPDSENGSILIFGESFDNAVLRLLAGHFNKLYSIDLRNYKAQMGSDFSLDSYLAAHPDVDRILFLGNLDFYVLDTFDLSE